MSNDDVNDADDSVTPRPGSVNWCYIHGRSELFAPTAYTMCFECQHVFATEADLLNAFNQKAADVAWRAGKMPRPRETDGNKVPFCPFCDRGWLA